MIDKYLKNDSNVSNERKKFLLQKKDVSEEDFNKIFSRHDHGPILRQDIEIIETSRMDDEDNQMNIDMEMDMDEYNEHNFIMKEEEMKFNNKRSKIKNIDSIDSPLKLKEAIDNDPDEISHEDENADLGNIYQNEGKIKNNNPNIINILTFTEREANERNNNDIIIDNHNDENFNSKNEYKLKRLQEKIEEKLRTEYNSKVKQKEKEIESKAKTEFEEAMLNYKSQLEHNMENDKEKMENDIRKKWEDKYDELITDCKSKLREEKEQKLAQRMYQKLRPGVEKEIYLNEYPNIVEKIKREIEEKITQEIYVKKVEEIEKAKRKLEYFAKVKLEEVEKNIKNKCKEELEMEVKKEVERKEKEFKTTYLRKFENFKNNLEKQLKEEYEAKKLELTKEVSEMKSRVYRQKCAEKLKMNKLNTIKHNLAVKEKAQFENAEKLEKILHSVSGVGSGLGGFSSGPATLKTFSSGKANNSNTNIVVNKNSVLNEYNLYDGDSTMEVNNSSSFGIGNANSNKPSTTKITNKNLTKITEEEETHGNNTRYNFESKCQSGLKSRQNEPDPDSNYDNLTRNNKNVINTPQLLSSNFGTISIGSPINNNNDNNSVNLFEINKKFKSLAPLNFDSDTYHHKIPDKKKEYQFLSAKEINMDNNSNCNSMTVKSLPEKEEVNCNVNNNQQKKLISIKNDLYKLDSPKKLSDTNLNQFLNTQNLMSSPNSNMSNFINTENNTERRNHNNVFVRSNSKNNNTKINSTSSNTNKIVTTNDICLSLKIEESIPTNLYEFGKFLVKYIEKEENFRILFEKEFKKIKFQIKKIFDSESSTDHCLTDYMIELWDKLDISFSLRYRIFSQLLKQ
jgi:hypothetical protein